LYGSEAFITGLDFAASRLTQVELFQIDARAIPFEEEFDVVGAFDVIEHIREDAAALKQMYKATCVGGGILLTVPQHPWLWSQVDEFSHHFRRYRSSNLCNLVEEVGFQVVRVTSFISFLLPLMVISRLRQQKTVKNWNPCSELMLSRWTNDVLESVLSLERYLIQTGISFPLGGSLLIVARK
jgi:SAM-dependent methyltransferase